MLWIPYRVSLANIRYQRSHVSAFCREPSVSDPGILVITSKDVALVGDMLE